MKSADEIKKGLECCKEDECFGDRENCPYTADPKLCVGVMCADALALIQQLQAENAEKDARIHQLEAERDAAINDVPRACGYCKYYVESADECTNPLPCACVSGVNTRWEWRGVQNGGPEPHD